MKVQELRQLFIDNKWLTEEEANAKSKKELSELKLEMEKAQQQETTSNNIVSEIPENPVFAEPVVSTNDENWTEYVLSHLRPNEKVLIKNKEFPTCDGLRRLFEFFIGKIIDVNVDLLQVPEINNHLRATSKVTIKYRPNNLTNEFRSISDVADCFGGNTAEPYCFFPTATATTMAESRCLRKGLRLVKVQTADETSSASEDIQEAFVETTQEKMTGVQKTAITNICKKLDINLQKVLETAENLKNRQIDTLTYNDAAIILRLLGLYQRGPDNKGLMIPKEIMNG